MEDRRIVKTKRMLRQALLGLLREKPFHSITVKEICDRASTSRITFYTYYDDKYALLDQLIANNTSRIAEEFRTREENNNAAHEMVQHCRNLIDATIAVQEEEGILRIIGEQKTDMEIIFYYYRHILAAIREIEKQYKNEWNTRYSVEEITAFFVAGFVGVMDEAVAAGRTEDEARREMGELMRDLLDGNIVKSKRHATE